MLISLENIAVKEEPGSQRCTVRKHALSCFSSIFVLFWKICQLIKVVLYKNKAGVWGKLRPILPC